MTENEYTPEAEGPIIDRLEVPSVDILLPRAAVEDAIRLIVEQQRNLFEQIQRQFQNQIAEFSSACTAAQAAVAVAWVKEFEEVGLRFRRTLERADGVGRLGWIISTEMGFGDVARLSSLTDPAEADSYMLDWYQNCDPDLANTEKRLLEAQGLEAFRTALSQCFSAFRRAHYAVTIPCLTSMVERGLRNLFPPEHFPTPQIERTVRELFDRAKDNGGHLVTVSIWMSLHAFVQWFYETYTPNRVGDERTFRHGIQHGTQPPSNEKVEALRLVHVLNAVAALCEE